MTVLKIAGRQPKVVFWKYQLSEGTARIWYHHKTTLEGYGDHLGHKISYKLNFKIKFIGYSCTIFIQAYWFSTVSSIWKKGY